MPLPISPAFEENNLAITLQTSEYFAPYASVTILSIIEQTSLHYNYDILVMTWDMQEETAQKLISMAEGRANVSVRILDVSEDIKVYQKIAMKRSDYEQFSAAGLVRLLIPELLTNYDTILNLDCDMLVCADVSELFEYNLTEYYMGAVPDMICYVLNRRPNEIQFSDELIFKTLQLQSVSEYLNAGLLLLNLKKIRMDFTQQQIIEYAISDGKFFTCYEQDTFNGLFAEKKLKLPPDWNWFVDSQNIILKWSYQYPITDQWIQNYRNAKHNVKIYHYVTSQKPWQDSRLIYSDKWWNAAQQSPFISRIINSLIEKDTKKKHTISSGRRRILFLCDSVYQFINILNIKKNYFDAVDTDLILCKSTNVIKYLEQIKPLNLFQHIYISNYDSHYDYHRILEIDKRMRSLFPEKYEKEIELDGEYTDFFIPVITYHYYQMIYYQMVKKGAVPAVHVYEDGGSTYISNFQPAALENIDHSLYPEHKRFYNNLRDVYMYRPDLYCGNKLVKSIPLPLINSSNPKLVQLLVSIFGKFDLPTQKYIFFNESFAEDHKVSNEIQILNYISSIVGKENIAVKIHPRATKIEALYVLHGYHIFSDNSIPWELSVLSADLSSKVLISISSNTIWTPYIIANRISRSISLLNTMVLSKRPHARQKEFFTLMKKVQAAINQNEIMFHIPNSISELKYIIQYIEGECV